MLFPLSSKQFENLLEQGSRMSALAKCNILMAEHFNAKRNENCSDEN